MNLEYSPAIETAIPEDVLAVLRDEHRLQCCHDPEAEPSIDLTFASTVDDWRNACDLVPWQDHGRALNGKWEINCSDQEWLAVLEPPRHRRIADVCSLIAAHTTQPSIRPARLLGKQCGVAGAFLTIRSLLYEAGAPVVGLKPSSSLEDYTKSHPAVFLGAIPRLAPGALPSVSISSTAYDRMITFTVQAILVSVGCRSVGAYISSYLMMIAALVLVAAIHVGWRYAGPRLPPASVEIEGLLTFRDLATAFDRAVPA